MIDPPDVALHYFDNKFASIKGDLVTINHHGKIVSMNLRDIRKIRFLKRRKLHWNFLFFLLSARLLVLVFSNTMDVIVDLPFFLVAMSLGVLAFFLKIYQYEFLMIKKYDFVEMKINEKCIEDVELLIFNIKKYSSKEAWH